MKQLTLILIILVFGFWGCQPKKKEAIITGTIIGKIQGEIEYVSSKNGACFWQFSKPLEIDSTGHFSLTLEIDHPTFFQIIVESYPQSSIIIEPGLGYKIELDANNNQLTVDCVNEKAQALYRNLLLDQPQNASSNFTIYKKPIPSNVFDSINVVKEKEILQFKELLDNNEISESFYELVKTDRTCYYTAIQSNFASAINYNAQQTGNDSLKTEVVKIWDKMFQNCPLDAQYAVNSFWFYPLSTDLMNFKKYWKQSTITDSLSQIYHSRNSLSFDVALAKILFNGKSEEYFIARYLQSATSVITKDKKLIELIQEFKNNYPESEFLPYLDNTQKSMTAYLKIADAPFNEKIKFIDNEKINSLAECVSIFKGKKVYIDVWASWCLPCRAEFKHLDDLRKLLKHNNVALLFISIDSGHFEKMWTDLIKYYNLEGYHIKANKQLDSDLKRIYNNGGSMTIPWNILVDENGQIMQLHASRPSQIGQLEKEIKNNVW